MFKVLLAAILACIAASAQAAPLTLECPGMFDVAKERQQIRALGAGVVVRRSEHDLRVTVQGKTLTFLDVLRDVDDIDWYQFCDRKDGFILLAYAVNDVFTGKLINEATGKVTPAGLSVVFSPDRRAYFADEQPDGLDGNVWLIYALDGRKSWSGFSFIPHVDDAGRMTATLSAPAWEASGRFGALAQCIGNSPAQWKVTLTNHGGKWDWLPKRACPTR
jgi:hypothetical protein